jgi:branched-chain amino acid transport system permease protein
MSAARRPRRLALTAGLVALVALLAAWPGVAGAGGDDEPGTPTTTAPVQGVTGTLLDAGEPMEGVEIVVATLDGAEVARAESGGNGVWMVPIDQPGKYRVTLDADTLPDDVELRDPERNPLEVDVFAGRLTTVLFALGEDVRAAGPSTAERVAQSTLNGVKFGLIVAMTAVGLSLIFGTTRLINFSHGEIVTFGAVVAWFLNARGPQLPLIAAGALAAVVTGLLGGSIELGLWRPLRARQVGLFQMFVITIGLALVIRHVILIWFGGARRPYTDYTIQDRWELGPVSITPRDLAVIVASIVILVAVATVLLRTRVGKAMRAVADDVDLSEASGIDVKRIILFVWVGGAGLAAVGGVFLGVIESVSFEMGFNLLLLMFAAVILGGLGTAFGAMVGGLVVGIATEVSTIWVQPSLKFVFALAALVLALLLRPQGILGRRERIG